MEFYFYSQYESHSEETLSLMHNALRSFRRSKDVFRQFRAGKKVTQEGKARQKELNAQRDEELKSMKHGSATQRERKRKEWNDFINHELIEHLEEGGDFNFPKIHQMLHFQEQIERYGCLKQWSAETGESFHRVQIKDGYNSSNRAGDFFSQIIEHYLRIDAFAVRKLNCSVALAEDDVRIGKQIDIPVTGNLKFISPQKVFGAGKITTFAAVLGSVSNGHLRDELRNATNCFLLSKRVNISPEKLLQCTAAVFHGLEIATTDMQGEQVIQRIRCSGEHSWHGAPPRHDWVWVNTSQPREGQEPPYKALRGRLPYRLLRLFKLRIPPENQFWCAFVETTSPGNAGGMPERASGMVRVATPTTGSGYAVINGGNIHSAAHLIPEEPVSSGIRNRSWIVNSHIDLATWNNVYYYI